MRYEQFCFVLISVVRKNARVLRWSLHIHGTQYNDVPSIFMKAFYPH